jgi:hypothetical protein
LLKSSIFNFYFYFHQFFTMKKCFFIAAFMVATALFVGCKDPSPPPQTGFYTDLQTSVKPQIDSALELTITSYGVSLADIHILDTTGAQLQPAEVLAKIASDAGEKAVNANFHEQVKAEAAAQERASWLPNIGNLLYSVLGIGLSLLSQSLFRGRSLLGNTTDNDRVTGL